MSRRCGGLPSIRSPWRLIESSVSSSKPAMHRNVVVLPQPLGPSNEKNSPSCTSNQIGPTLTCGEYRLVRPHTSSSTLAGTRCPSPSRFAGPSFSPLAGRGLGSGATADRGDAWIIRTRVRTLRAEHFLVPAVEVLRFVRVHLIIVD